MLGVGRVIPRMFQTVQVYIGKPLDLSEMLGRPLPVERGAEIDLYRDIADRVVREIRALGPQET